MHQIKNYALLAAMLATLAACTDSIETTMSDVKNKGKTEAIISGEVESLSSGMPTDVFVKDGDYRLYATLPAPHNYKIGESVKLKCTQLRVNKVADMEILYSEHCNVVD